MISRLSLGLREWAEIYVIVERSQAFLHWYRRVGQVNLPFHITSTSKLTSVIFSLNTMILSPSLWTTSGQQSHLSRRCQCWFPHKSLGRDAGRQIGFRFSHATKPQTDFTADTFNGLPSVRFPIFCHSLFLFFLSNWSKLASDNRYVLLWSFHLRSVYSITFLFSQIAFVFLEEDERARGWFTEVLGHVWDTLICVSL